MAPSIDFNKTFSPKAIKLMQDVKPDFQSIIQYIEPYAAKEKATENEGSASKLMDYVMVLRDACNSGELKTDSFNRLFSDKSALPDFLGKYGYDKSNDPEMEKLSELFLTVNILGSEFSMQKEAAEYTYFKEKIDAAEFNENAQANEMQNLVRLSHIYNEENPNAHIFDIETIEDSLANLTKENADAKKSMEEELEYLEKNIPGLENQIQESAAFVNNYPGLQEAISGEAKFAKVLARYEKGGDLYEKNQETEVLKKAVDDYSAAKKIIDEKVKKDADIVAQYNKIREEQAAERKLFRTGDTSEELTKRATDITNAISELQVMHATFNSIGMSIKEMFRNPEDKLNAQSLDTYNKNKKILTEALPQLSVAFSAIEETEDPRFEAAGINFILNNDTLMNGITGEIDRCFKGAAAVKSYQEKTQWLQKFEKENAAALSNLNTQKKIGDSLKAANAKYNEALSRNHITRVHILTESLGFTDVQKAGHQHPAEKLSFSEFKNQLSLWRAEEERKINTIRKQPDLLENVDKIKECQERLKTDSKDLYEQKYKLHKEVYEKTKLQMERAARIAESKKALTEQCKKQAEKIQAVHQELRGRENDSLTNVRSSLDLFSRRLNALEKGSGNTQFFDNMTKALNQTAEVLNQPNPNPGYVWGLMHELGLQAQTYIDEKQKQFRPFESNVRKLRLGVAKDLVQFSNIYRENYCKNTLLSDSVKEEVDSFMENKAVPSGKELFGELQSKAEKYFAENKQELDIAKDIELEEPKKPEDRIQDAEKDVERIRDAENNLLLDDDDNVIDDNFSEIDRNDFENFKEYSGEELQAQLEREKEFINAQAEPDDAPSYTKRTVLEELETERFKLMGDYQSFSFNTETTIYGDYKYYQLYEQNGKIALDENDLPMHTLTPEQFAKYNYYVVMKQLVEKDLIEPQQYATIMNPETADKLSVTIQSQNFYKNCQAHYRGFATRDGVYIKKTGIYEYHLGDFLENEIKSIKNNLREKEIEKREAERNNPFKEDEPIKKEFSAKEVNILGRW